MRNVNDFVKERDLLQEKDIDKKIRVYKELLNESKNILLRYYSPNLEVDDGLPQQIEFGALTRCMMNLRSVLCLINSGYYGSSFALLRQAHELLSWAKIADGTKNEKVLSRMKKDFYLDEDERSDKFRKYSIKYEYENYSRETTLAMKEYQKQKYGRLSQFTHATHWAQQEILSTEYFYEMIKFTLREFAKYLYGYVCVVEQYFKKVFDKKRENEAMLDSFETIKLYALFNYIMEETQKWKVKILNSENGIDKSSFTIMMEYVTWIAFL